MLIGYSRVSTIEQNLDLQTDALTKAGCDKIFKDVASGVKTNKNGLDEALNSLREGDMLVVWKLDRLGRSLKHLIEVINQLHQQKISFKSLRENIDTTSSGGKLIFHIFCALAEFERDVMRERTLAGLSSARARGKFGGRPRAMDKKKVAMARKLMSDASNSVEDVCKILGISRATLYRYVRRKE